MTNCPCISLTARREWFSFRSFCRPSFRQGWFRFLFFLNSTRAITRGMGPHGYSRMELFMRNLQQRTSMISRNNEFCQGFRNDFHPRFTLLFDISHQPISFEILKFYFDDNLRFFFWTDCYHLPTSLDTSNIELSIDPH